MCRTLSRPVPRRSGLLRSTSARHDHVQGRAERLGLAATHTVPLQGRFFYSRVPGSKLPGYLHFAPPGHRGAPARSLALPVPLPPFSFAYVYSRRHRSFAGPRPFLC